MTSATDRYQQARDAYEAVKADPRSHPDAVQRAWDEICATWAGMVEEQEHEMALKRFAESRDKG